MKHVPGVAAALADAAIGYNFFIRSHSFALIQSAQFVGRFECPVFTYCLRPGNVGCTWDMATSLRTLLWQIRGSEQLSAKFSRGAEIDQGNVTMASLCEDLIAHFAYLGIRVL